MSVEGEDEEVSSQAEVEGNTQYLSNLSCAAQLLCCLIKMCLIESREGYASPKENGFAV